MKIQFDRRHDVLYVQYAAHASARQQRTGDRVVDYAADSSIVGIEFLAPSRGIDLSDVPRARDVGRAIARYGIAVVAPQARSRRSARSFRLVGTICK